MDEAAAGMTPVLELLGLIHSFGALRVTQDVSLAIGAGEVHALIGPNGAGKTTLVNQIAGSLRPDAGRVLLDGEDVTALGSHERARRGLARSFQMPALIGGFSALENVALAVQGRARRPLAIVGNAAADEALNAPARATLAAVGLGGREAARGHDLSHGERRVLELACVLAGEPRCLILDEPLAGLGHGEAAAVVALLGSLKGRYAMLLVEHDMDAVFALADRVSVLVEGRIVARGTPGAVRADPVVRDAYLGEA